MTMLAKALCLMATSFAYIQCMLPPPSNKALQTDKVTDEHWLKMLGGTNILPIVAAALNILETGTYIFLMTTASKSSPLPAVQQLAVFKLWHAAATVLSLSGFALRKWSFVTLDRFFTYQLTIRSGHKLVQSGPYTYLRHPSYTGALMTGFGSFMLLFHRGLWPVLVTYAAKWTNQLVHSGTPVLSSLAALSPFAGSNYARMGPKILGINIGLWIMVMMSAFGIRVLMYRVEAEEEMLKQHFGRDWDEKTDKITDERHMRKLGGANVVTTAAAFLTLLQTTTYIYLMTYSKSSFLPAIQQLSEFERWHAVAAAVTVAGFALRKWSFMTLDRFFTVS
ncbi:hypothetical protein BG005_003001 [Podila minutissima]|nr:hypothetical protein BG005_003001 [Podila minutissima]